MNRSCNKKHGINLSNINVEDGDVVVFSEFIILRGFIDNRCLVNDVVILKNQTTHIAQTSVLSKDNEFKFLCELGPGKQTLELIYCSKVIFIECFFKETSNPYTIQPLYIICKGHDGSFNSSLPNLPNDFREACKIIDLNLKIVQCLYAEKLNEQGFGRKTFNFKDKCQVFYSNVSVEDARQLDEISLWNVFGKELLSSTVYNARVKFVGFLSCTKYSKIENGDFSYENIKRHTKGHAALGVGGLAIFGSGYFYAWPRNFSDVLLCFTNQQKVDLENFLDDSNYRRTFAGVYSSSLGSVAHEIGHIFDLGHTKNGIMGTDFDYINRVFTMDNLTESLPKRIVKNYPTGGLKDKRLTQIRKVPNQFLEKYHEQKCGDSVFFTRNCTIILAYHKWLQTQRNKSESDDKSSINFDRVTKLLTSKTPIKLIEIRENPNAFVVGEYEFNDSANVYSFQIPTVYQNIKQYNIFIICVNGDVKLIQ